MSPLSEEQRYRSAQTIAKTSISITYLSVNRSGPVLRVVFVHDLEGDRSEEVSQGEPTSNLMAVRIVILGSYHMGMI